MIRRRFWAVLALLVCSSYSYSEEVFESSQNAAQNGLSWDMANILPSQAGLAVNGVIYRYTTVKDPNDPMLVHVQNENAQGPGYIFRSTDDWSGLPGNTINRVIPLNGIPRELWGDGSIDVEGKGSVEDASVFYTYQYDPCFDPQSSPDCPGYKDPFVMEILDPDIVDPLDDEFIQDELDRKANLKDEEEDERNRKRIAGDKKKDDRLEAALSIAQIALATAEAEALAQQLVNMNVIPQTYYVAIPGGTYEETSTLKDSNLPDNKRGLRANYAQQILHEKMVNSQYDN